MFLSKYVIVSKYILSFMNVEHFKIILKFKYQMTFIWAQNIFSFSFSINSVEMKTVWWWVLLIFRVWEKINRPFSMVEPYTSWKSCVDIQKTSSGVIPGYSIADFISPQNGIIIYGTTFLFQLSIFLQPKCLKSIWQL